MASAISRWAIAERVSESSSSSTCRPWSRKCSATAVAYEAPCMRNSGGASAGGAPPPRARAAVCAQNVFDEFLDLAAALANQSDHDHVGARVAGHHAQQHALAHPRA